MTWETENLRIVEGTDLSRPSRKSCTWMWDPQGSGVTFQPQIPSLWPIREYKDHSLKASKQIIFFSNLRTMYIAYHVFHPPQDLLQLFELIFLDVVNFSVRNRILKNQRFSNTTKIIELSISDVMKFVKDFDAKFSLFSYYLSVTLRGNRSISK